MGLRTRNDIIPAGERAFMIASIRKAFEEGETPILLKNMAKPKKKEGN